MTTKHPKATLWSAALLALIAAAFLPASSEAAAGDVDAARLKAADSQPQNWFTLVRDGNQFDDVLSEADADAIHAYLIDQVWQIYKQQ
jgi:hypothetical protein